ncbi:LOW QUALITY PROTEIN: formin-like protein 6 [Gossypium hirsutum]|uniref:Formin-like protein n=1 Tax=Gossypium hirsutum TaxID=3635 RepID=A0A1U8JGQ2_GOSHI|nr:LOW QUALITY PROTEIN: formin-like protein 6 [Gossypium hirsutum]
MGLFRKLFFRKPPDGLLEISERVYLFDCCFSTDIREEKEYRVYIENIVCKLRDHFTDASFMVFNFREGEYQSQIASILSEYDMTVMDYPRQYEGCPLLTTELIHHFLKSSENWFSLGQQNIILMHSERGGLPVLAFMLTALLLYRKQYSGEQKTLEMIYKQAPRELLHLTSPLNPLPSQLRYLQYVSRRNVGSEWPPSDKALTLDCIILRCIPNMDGEGGCRLIFRIYGQDPFMAADRTPKVLFSTPKNSKFVRYYKQADCELVKINIRCHVVGDVVLECISLDSNLERELMVFRIMFNTAFIRSNILMLNRDEIDILWNTKDQFPKDFSAEVIFSDIDVAPSAISIDFPGIEEKNGLSIDDFAKVQEIFSRVDYTDVANMLQENLETGCPKSKEIASVLHDAKVEEKSNSEAPEHVTTSPTSDALEKQSIWSFQSSDANSTRTKFEPEEIQVVPQMATQHTPSAVPSSDSSSTEGKTESQELQVALQEAELTNSSRRNVEIQEIQVSSQQPAQSTSTFTPVLDVNSIRKKTEPQELQVAVQRPAQPMIISQRGPQSSISSPVSYCNSLPGSPAPISRYRSPPSALGITALLHDHDASESEDHSHPVASSLSSSSVSSPLSHTPKHLQLTRAIASPGQSSFVPPPPPPLPSFSGASPAYQPPPSLEVSPPSVKSSFQSPPILPLLYIPFLGHLHLPWLRIHQSLPPSSSASLAPKVENLFRSPPPPPPLPPSSATSPSSSVKNSFSAPPPPPPPPPPLPPFSAISPSFTVKNSSSAPPPPPPLPNVASSTTCPNSCSPQIRTSGPPPPHAPPPQSGSISDPTSKSSVPRPPPPPPPSLAAKGPSPNNSAHVPPVPPPPAPCAKGLSKAGDTSPQLHSVSNGNIPSIPGPPSAAPLNLKGRGISRIGPKSLAQPRKNNLKPYHWLKLTRAMQGSLWAEAQKPEEASKAPEIDMSELESLFSAAAPNSDNGSRDGKSNRGASGRKPEKVQLIELRRAYNCEIMLTKVKIPLPDLTSSVLTMDDTALDSDQLENLIKFCPTKEETELLKGYNGDKEKLGKCEQFFLELIKVPRVESKLRVFLFKIQFSSQVSDLRNGLNIINSTAEEVRNSVKLKRIMQTILYLGNALNKGTARGSAVGFRLDSLLKLSETRARNNKMTLMHYLCKVLNEKSPELLEFPKDLVTLEASTKIQLKCLAEEMQAISKGLEKVVQELTASENDGPVSETFCWTLKEFLGFAESEVRSLALLYSSVGRNADALALYFGEDPARCPFEQVVSTLLNFVRMFVRAHEENCKQLELEKKKAQKEADNEKLKVSTPTKKSEHLK